MQALTTPLKDIMPAVNIEVSLLPAMLLGLGIVLLLAWSSYRIKQWYHKRETPLTPAQKALHTLHAMTTEELSSKEGLYQLNITMQCYLGNSKDTTYEKLQERLTPYKYQDTVQTIDPLLIQEIQAYIKGLT